MLSVKEARSIAYGWIAPNRMGMTAFATGHPAWTPETLADDVVTELNAVLDRPQNFDDPIGCRTELRQLLEFARSFTGRI